MARTRFTVRTLVPILGGAVLVLGGLCAWVFVRQNIERPSETPSERAARQVQEQRPGWEIRYIEAGADPAVCGYAAPRRRSGAPDQPVAFVSRIGRILFSDEPLPTEFRDLRDRFCPALAQAPAAPNYVNTVPAP
jgi:hypothetical protein